MIDKLISSLVIHNESSRFKGRAINEEPNHTVGPADVG